MPFKYSATTFVALFLVIPVSSISIANFSLKIIFASFWKVCFFSLRSHIYQSKEVIYQVRSTLFFTAKLRFFEFMKILKLLTRIFREFLMQGTHRLISKQNEGGNFLDYLKSLKKNHNCIHDSLKN